jgi:hypothetical protein
VIVPPCDLTARCARHNDPRWRGSWSTSREACDNGAVSIITDVTTAPSTLYGIKGALPAIHNPDTHRAPELSGPAADSVTHRWDRGRQQAPKARVQRAPAAPAAPAVPVVIRWHRRNADERRVAHAAA